MASVASLDQVSRRIRARPERNRGVKSKAINEALEAATSAAYSLDALLESDKAGAKAF